LAGYTTILTAGEKLKFSWSNNLYQLKVLYVWTSDEMDHGLDHGNDAVTTILGLVLVLHNNYHGKRSKKNISVDDFCVLSGSLTKCGVMAAIEVQPKKNGSDRKSVV
jgi:hypothetical protein